MRIAKLHYVLLAAVGATGLTGCESIMEEATEAVGFEYVAMLSPLPGHSGSGKAEVSINDATNQICTDLEVDNNTTRTVTSAHIHLGPTGPVYVYLDSPDDNDSDDCDTVTDALIDHMRSNPRAYYVDVHTADHPRGALRGQLRKER